MAFIQSEIELHATPADKPVLRWLFHRYHRAGEWAFVATCRMERFGPRSYEARRVWAPTAEGRALYAAPMLLDALDAQVKFIDRVLLPAEELADTARGWIEWMRQ